MIKAVIFDYFGVIWVGLRKNPKILQFAAELRQQGIKTPILSNVIKPIGWGLRLANAYKGFDPVILSGEAGIDKPNAEIYKIILKKIDCKPSECIFIDNRPENLVEPGRMGIHVVLAKKTDQVIADIKQILSQTNVAD
jgi:putative hydrolase of the HAD superfamily